MTISTVIASTRSRIEGICEPGQVFISGGTCAQIKNKLVCGYESLGDRKVKNITDPVSPSGASGSDGVQSPQETDTALVLLISLIWVALQLRPSVLVPRLQHGIAPTAPQLQSTSPPDTISQL
jgi:hypothetical protein